MKGFIKGIATAAAVLFAIGIGTIVFGAVTGGRMVNVPIGDSGFNIYSGWDFDWWNDDTYNSPDSDNTINAPSGTKLHSVPKKQDIDSLDFEIGAADFKIVYGDDFKFETEGKYNYTSEVDGSTWRIQITGKNMFRTNLEKVKVTIPTDIVFEKVKFSFGAGNFNVDDIVTDVLDMELGAGNFDGSGFVVNDKTKISCGAANAEISGIFEGKNVYECGAGRLVVDFDEEPTDYGYSVELGLGHVQLFDQSFNGIADRQSNQNASTFFEVECGVGSLEIS